MRLTSVLVLGLGLTLSAGCAIDKGSALAQAFEEHWADTPDVAQLETTRDNVLPFAGYASGTLILEEGTPTDRAIELASELSEFVADHDDLAGRIVVEDFSFTVAGSEERTEEVLALWQSLASDGRVEEGDIGLRRQSEDRWDIKVSVVDGAAALSVFDGLAADGDAFRPFSWTEESSLEVSGGSLLFATGDNGDLPAEAIAAYEAVAAQHMVASAELRMDRVRIWVVEATARSQAEALAEAAAPSLDAAAVDVFVEGT